MINNVQSLQNRFKKIEMLFCTKEVDEFSQALVALEQELKVGLYQVEGAEKSTSNKEFKANCQGTINAYKQFLGIQVISKEGSDQKC
jgi:hypothetical protein